MLPVPVYISLVFGFTSLLAVGLFYKASHHSTSSLVILLSWLVIQAFISLAGFYTVTDTLPPRLMLAVLPALLLIIGLFTSEKGRAYIDRLDIKTLTLLHISRVPVELVLYWLFLNNTVPGLMTFAGRNFDILAGLTAPLIYYYGFIKKRFGRKTMLTWNFVCLGLLLNIVINAVLSAPFPFQQFAFEQPNIAVLYFPFIWLPSCVVPLVLFSHLATIRQLLDARAVKEPSQLQ